MDVFVAEARALGYTDVLEIREYVSKRQDEERH